MLADLNYKRIILAILIVIISLGLLFGVVWLVFLRSPGDLTPQGGEETGGGALPGVGSGSGGVPAGSGGVLPGGEEGGEEGTIKNPSLTAEGSFTLVNRVTDDEVKEVNLSGNSFNFLSAEDDKFYRLLSDGTKILLSEEDFPYVKSAVWANNGNKVILEYPDGANIIYDFTKGSKSTLPLGMEGAVFDSNGENIAYKYVTDIEENNWLVVSDINNSQAKAVEPIGNEGNKVQVNWSPNNQVVALFRDPIGLSREEIYFIGLNDENFKSLIVEGSNFEGKWSPDGSKILYHILSPESGYNPVLWVADARTNNIGNNNFNLGLPTWVSKCVFASAIKVYCAVPLRLPEGSGLYPDLVNDKPDVFYEVDLSSGVSSLIAYPVLSEDVDQFQVERLFISEDKNFLYFWDKWTDKIYSLKLN